MSRLLIDADGNALLVEPGSYLLVEPVDQPGIGIPVPAVSRVVAVPGRAPVPVVQNRTVRVRVPMGLPVVPWWEQ